MPLIKSRCLTPKCPNRILGSTGRCAVHQPKPYSQNFRAERLPRNWAMLRKQVLQRDKLICYLCGEYGADAVDHKINNDDDSLDNLGAVHERVYPYCHRTKTAMEAQVGKQNNMISNSHAETLRRARNKGLI